MIRSHSRQSTCTEPPRKAHRITQLGGTPDYNPATLVGRSHSEYDDSDELLDMIREDLVAERIAIAAYTEVVQWLGTDDPTDGLCDSLDRPPGRVR